MKALARRLCRLEMATLPPAVDHESERIADLILEARRRRLEADGLPAEEPLAPIYLPAGRRLTVAESIIAAKERLRARQRE